MVNKLASPVAALSVEDINSPAGHAAGAFAIDDDQLLYRCPCGCAGVGGLKIMTAAEKSAAVPDQHTWAWDGDRERPTLEPSIKHSVGDGKGGMVEHWHGYLRERHLERCLAKTTREGVAAVVRFFRTTQLDTRARGRAIFAR